MLTFFKKNNSKSKSNEEIVEQFNKRLFRRIDLYHAIGLLNNIFIILAYSSIAFLFILLVIHFVSNAESDSNYYRYEQEYNQASEIDKKSKEDFVKKCMQNPKNHDLFTIDGSYDHWCQGEYSKRTEGYTELDKLKKKYPNPPSGVSYFFSVLILLFLLVLILLSYLLLPILIAVPFSMLLLIIWSKPYNILVLRPFSDPNRSKNLKRLVRNGLSGLGFFYTLSDRQIEQKWYIKYPSVLWQLSLFHFRFRRIRKQKSIDKLKRAMMRQDVRLINWVFSWNKIFPVSCDDNQWKECIRQLIPCVDFIIIDVTGSPSATHNIENENLKWEIEKCKKGNLYKTLFISKQDSKISEDFDREFNQNYYNLNYFNVIPYVDGSGVDAIRIARIISYRLAVNEVNHSH